MEGECLSRITVNKASRSGVSALSRKLLRVLEDRESQLYKDNVAKFGIPEALAKEAFSEKALLEAVNSGKSTFYLALENGRKILGFAQVTLQDNEVAELDRIVVFPEYARQGIGTKLLSKVIRDEEKRGVSKIVVSAGKDEKHARMFYEKNGFEAVEEKSLEASWGKIPLVIYQLTLKSRHQKNESR